MHAKKLTRKTGDIAGETESDVCGNCGKIKGRLYLTRKLQNYNSYPVAYG